MRTLPADIASWSNQDLNWLDSFASAQILALGEVVHTSDGFYSAKVRMMKYLIEHQGYRAVAWENPFLKALSATRYVENTQGTVEEAMGGLFRVWRSTSVRDFLQWLQEWNSNNPEKFVRFFGNDTQQPEYDLHLLLNSNFLSGDQKNLLKKYVSNFFGSEVLKKESYAKIFNDLLSQGFDGLESKVEKITSLVDDIKVPEDSLEFAALLSLKACVDFNFYTVKAQASQSEEDHLKSYGARDKCMSDLTRHFAQNQKTILWAHNQHIQRPDVSHSGGYLVFQGQFLRQALGVKYQAIGLSARRIGMNWPWTKALAPTISASSLEDLLMQRGTMTYAGPSSEFDSIAANSYAGIYNLNENEKVSDRFDGLVVLPKSLGIEYVVEVE